MDDIKNAILTALPGSLGKQLYFLKNGSRVMHTELMKDLFIDLEIRKHDNLWADRLSQREGHEPGICEWFAKYLTPKDSFFDIGSCYGIFSALVAKLQPSIPIHAWEPAFANFLFLEQNAKRNKGNVAWKLSRKFVSDTNDSENTTLDEYCKNNNIYPTVIKMDIDGGEYHALKNAEELIKRRKTHFLIEIHPQFLGDRNIKVDQVLELFPKDFTIKVLPEIRDKNLGWTDDLSLIYSDFNPYIYVAAEEIYLL